MSTVKSSGRVVAGAAALPGSRTQQGPRPGPARTSSEDDLLASVLDLCALLHLHVAHFRPARTVKGWRTPVQGNAGFPDLVIAGRRVLYRELKSARGTVEPEQQAWLLRLEGAGADVGVWRPADWMAGRIQ